MLSFVVYTEVNQMPFIPSPRREKKIGTIPHMQYSYFSTLLASSKQHKNKDVVGCTKEQLESDMNIYVL